MRGRPEGQGEDRRPCDTAAEVGVVCWEGAGKGPRAVEAEKGKKMVLPSEPQKETPLLTP